MNSNEIRSLFVEKGIGTASKMIEEQIKDKTEIKNAIVIFVFFVGFLFGLFTMYLCEK